MRRKVWRCSCAYGARTDWRGRLERLWLEHVPKPAFHRTGLLESLQVLGAGARSIVSFVVRSLVYRVSSSGSLCLLFTACREEVGMKMIVWIAHRTVLERDQEDGACLVRGRGLDKSQRREMQREETSLKDGI
jgi:hypothetical protein